MTTILKRISNKVLWMLQPKYKKSYSQNGEDIIIERIFRKLSIKSVFYIDIGTNHPKNYNNTYSLYRKGSNGMCIEPDVDLFTKIKRVRPRDIVKNIGISDSPGTLNYFAFRSKEYNTFSEDEANKNIAQGLVLKTKYTVPIQTLGEIIDSLPRVPDLISLDIEGYDERVIRSFDFSKYKPLVWCIETIIRDGDQYKKNDSLIQMMIDNGYSVYGDTRINTIFLDNRSMLLVSKVKSIT